MNREECANCLLHGWKEVEDSTTLQRCKRCKFIKYCGRDCQREHWLRVHHKHCKYFADPDKAAQWVHKKENCIICHQASVVGINQIMRPDNPNYGCIFEETKRVPSHYLHPHPFPATGDPGDIHEKSVLVLTQLLNKFALTQSGIVGNFQDDFGKVFSHLMAGRVKIWGARKISPQPHLQFFNSFRIDLSHVDKKVRGSESIPDPFQLWKIMRLVGKIIHEVDYTLKWNGIINPLADIPEEFRAAVSQGTNNSVKFLATANQVLDALAMQLIPYQNVLMIICGGSLEKACNFCSKQITIAEVAVGFTQRPFVWFGFAHITIYCCVSNNCIQKAISMKEDFDRAEMAIKTAITKRCHTQCDYCFKFPPSKDVHRCSRCLSVMYCSTDCRDQDWNIHKKVCKEDVEERKKKCGRSDRRKEARDTLEKMEKSFEVMFVEEPVQVYRHAQEVLGKFKVKNSKKQSDK